mgnify:CR=1 FL=1
MSQVKQVTGRSVVIRGNDIDTDRIIPARFLRCVVFEGLGEHAFADDRIQMKEAGEVHPFDAEANQGAKLLFVNKNFGCGSSREHAPQSLMRWGISGIVGESYSEIFYGNNVSLGIPCAIATEENIEILMKAVEADSSKEFKIDLETLTVTNGEVSVPVTIPEGPRQQFLQGSWDVTSQLLEADAEIDTTTADLPYFNHWK